MDEKIWYYARGSEQKGPIDAAELNMLIAVSAIGPDTLMWRDGMADWEPAAAVLPDDLRPSDWPAPPRTPPARPSMPPVASQAPTAEEWAATDHPTEFMESVKRCFNKYAAFSGRARRPEYWYFVLFNFLVSIGLNIVDATVFGLESGFEPLGTIYSLAIFVPSLAVGARRLHDTGRSGWWQLIWLIPIIGWIVLIIWLASQGDEEPNEYGPA